MLRLIVFLAGLSSLGLSMDLAPQSVQESSYSIFNHIVQSLYYLYTGKVQAVLHRDLPDEFFATFAPHEKKMLKIIREAHEQVENKTAFASLDDIPLEKIIQYGLLDEENLPWDSFKINQIDTDLFVYCPNIVKYSPTATDSHELYEQLVQIYATADHMCNVIKTHLSEFPISNIYISGHHGGTAIAQLVALTLQCDQELQLDSKGIKVFSIGFGEFRVFSPKMIRKLDKIAGFDRKRHLVFAGFERYFSPNFGSLERFGTIIDINLDLLFHGGQLPSEYLEQASNFASDQFHLLTESLTKKIADTSSRRIFAREAPFALSSLYSCENSTFHHVPSYSETDETEMTSAYHFNSVHSQQIFVASMFLIEKMFKKYFHCLSRPEYFVNLAIVKPLHQENLSVEPFGEAIATIHCKFSTETVNFLFRIYPDLPKDSFWSLLGMHKIKRAQSYDYSIYPNQKYRNRFENWCNFFRMQWSRISGPGAVMMKSLSPFFDESILCPLGIESCHSALIVDPDALMNMFLSRDPSTIKFLRDVFGPKKSEFYLDFKEAQKLIRVSAIEFQESAGIISYVMPRNRPLLDVVQHFFRETEFDLQNLVDLEGSLSIGTFSVKQILSYSKQDFKTNVMFSEVYRKMQKPDYLYTCVNQVSAKQCPLMSLRKPNIPFWKRVMRVRDTYIAFIGSSAVHLPGNYTKLDLVMEHLGPAARPFVYKETGSFAVFEVYSKVKGFGPYSQQGMFYLMLVQDPHNLIY